jgi:ferritin-like metal-binding protein YciE
MEGLLKEGDEMLNEDFEDAVLDAGLIAAAQRVEHYEIAAYGTLVAYAKLLGDPAAAEVLESSLAEEKEADEALSNIAESTVNAQAAGMSA